MNKLPVYERIEFILRELRIRKYEQEMTENTGYFSCREKYLNYLL